MTFDSSPHQVNVFSNMSELENCLKIVNDDILPEVNKCFKKVNDDILPMVNDRILPKVIECLDKASSILSMMKTGAVLGGGVAVFWAVSEIWKRCFPPPPPPPPRDLLVLLYPPPPPPSATP